MARRAPAALASSTALETAPACPAITTWSGELRLAALTTSPCAASLKMDSSLPSGSFSSAAIAPTPGGTASCMYRPAFADQTYCVAKL